MLGGSPFLLLFWLIGAHDVTVGRGTTAARSLFLLGDHALVLLLFWLLGAQDVTGGRAVTAAGSPFLLLFWLIGAASSCMASCYLVRGGLNGGIIEEVFPLLESCTNTTCSYLS